MGDIDVCLSQAMDACYGSCNFHVNELSHNEATTVTVKLFQEIKPKSIKIQSRN